MNLARHADPMDEGPAHEHPVHPVRPSAPDGRRRSAQNRVGGSAQPLPVTTVRLREFTWEAALDYLTKSGAYTAPDGESGLSEAEEQAPAHDEEEEKEKLVRLTRGYPLWLAFAVDYSRARGSLRKAEAPLAEIEDGAARRGGYEAGGQRRHEAFKRRLVRSLPRGRLLARGDQAPGGRP